MYYEAVNTGAMV